MADGFAPKRYERRYTTICCYSGVSYRLDYQGNHLFITQL